MAGKAFEYPTVPDELHRNLSLRKTQRRYQQRYPIDQQLRSDGPPPEVWDLCFGWQARTGIKEEIERPLELYKGLDCIIPTFPIRSTVNQKYRLGRIT
jgi:hypothetical protein